MAKHNQSDGSNHSNKTKDLRTRIRWALDQIGADKALSITAVETAYDPAVGASTECFTLSAGSVLSKLLKSESPHDLSREADVAAVEEVSRYLCLLGAVARVVERGIQTILTEESQAAFREDARVRANQRLNEKDSRFTEGRSDSL